MAVARIEEKILGRLAKQTAPSNVLLSESMFKVLGLSILLQQSLGRARRQRRLDQARDATSLQLYQHIIWLAREGLSITEVYILPYCQNGEQGAECRVMAAKLRAGFYHVFCLYHNYPSVSQLSLRSQASAGSPPSTTSPKVNNGPAGRSPGTPSRNGKERIEKSRRAGKAALRDPIPSMNSDASYITNPYAGMPSQTPPPAGPPPPIPVDTRRTPTRPPGLTPVNIPEAQLAASFLLPPLNFVPMAKEHFDTAQRLSTKLLPAAHALRLSVALDNAVFTWDCAKDSRRSLKIARRTVDAVYKSSEELTDEEFEDASLLVRSLAAIVQRGTNEPTPRPSKEGMTNANQPVSRGPLIDRTIAVSPPNQAVSYQQMNTVTPSDMRGYTRTPERLSTVPEVESVEAEGDRQTLPATSPPISRLSSRSRQRRGSSAASDKASKRRAAEQAEELHRRSSASNRSNASGSSHSRQPTPQEGARSQPPTATRSPPQQRQQQPVGPRPLPIHEVSILEERRIAILSALEIIASVSQGLWVPEKHRSRVHHRVRLT